MTVDAGLAAAAGTAEFTPGTQVSLTLTELNPAGATGTALFTPGTEISLTIVEVLPVRATGTALPLPASGPFRIWLPGGCVHFGTVTVALPRPAVALAAHAGIFGHLAVVLPPPRTDRRLTLVLAPPRLSLAGHVTRIHSGGFVISLGQCSGMDPLFRLLGLSWALPPDPDPVDWTTGQPHVNWAALLPWKAWNVGYTSISVSHLSTQYVAVPVQAVKNGSPYNPTSDPVQFAFAPTPTYVPQSGDWVNGSWVTAASNVLYPYSAQCLVGPGGTITLGLGTYIMYIRISDAPETPVQIAGQLQIT